MPKLLSSDRAPTKHKKIALQEANVSWGVFECPPVKDCSESKVRLHEAWEAPEPARQGLFLAALPAASLESFRQDRDAKSTGIFTPR